MMMFLILTFFIAGQALAQNVLIVEGHPPIELQSMTAAQIAEMEKAQREQERANTIPAPVLREPVVHDRVIIIREAAPVQQKQKTEINIGIDQRRRTPYPYHFEMRNGILTKVRDK